MFGFLGALFTILFILVLVPYIGFSIIAAICRAIYNSVERSKYTGSNYSYGDTDYIDKEVNEVIDVDYDQIEEEERMGEAYMCPECFEPYDGIQCDVCGFRPEIGYEEISDDERYVEDFIATMLFNEEDKRREAEREEKLFDDFGFDGDFNDEFDGDF